MKKILGLSLLFSLAALQSQAAPMNGPRSQGIIRQGVIRQGIIRQGQVNQGASSQDSQKENIVSSLEIQGVEAVNGQLVQSDE